MTTLLAAMAWTLALALCVPGWRARPVRAVLVLAIVGGVLHLPLADTSLIAALRGLFGELALLSTVVLAALWLARAGATGLFGRGERYAVAVLGGLVGAVFYPAALGLTATDPYAWGYGAPALPLIAGGIAMLAWASGCRVLAAGLVAALLGWRLHGLASPNLWDYLIDPLLALGGVVALLVMLLKSAYRAIRKPAAARSVAKASEAR